MRDNDIDFYIAVIDNLVYRAFCIESAGLYSMVEVFDSKSPGWHSNSNYDITICLFTIPVW